MKFAQMHALAQGFGRGRTHILYPTANTPPLTTNVNPSTPSSSSAERPPTPVTRQPHVKSGRQPRPYEPMQRLAGVLGNKSGVGDIELTPGAYHISGTQVQVRVSPSAKAAVKGVLLNGEGVYVFGETETDPEFMLGPNNEAVPNDGTDPGIIYARVGTQNHGAGWVAAYFLASGPGTQVTPEPAPQPKPVVEPPPETTPPAKKSALVPVLVGGAIGSAVLLTGALIYRASKKSSRTRAYA